MDPPPLQPSDIDLSSSPIPAPDDQIQTLTKPNPSSRSPPADSDAVKSPLLPDPNSDPPNPPDLEDPDDQEGMTLSPSHPPLSSPPSRSSRRPLQNRRGRTLGKRKLAILEKKSEALSKSMKSVPFVPTKVLDFSKHEDGLKKLGLWDFAHLEFDRKVRNDLIAKLIINYNDKNRSSYIDDCRLLVNQTDMARALNLPCKRPPDCGEIDWPGDFVSFVDDFVSTWMLLHEDTWVLPSEVITWTEMIKEGHPEKVEWAKLIWFMIKRELSKGSHLENCYYASHLQHLIKCQKEVLLKEKSLDKEEIIVLKDDEEDEGDVKMLEYDEDSHGIECEMDTENALTGVEECIGSAQSDVKMEGNDGDVGSLGSGGGTTKHAVQVENNQNSGDQTENLMVSSGQEETLKNLGDHGDSLNTIDDHVKNLETAVNQLQNLETSAVDHVENLEMASADLVENLKSAVVNHVENLETAAVDHAKNHEIVAVDDVENHEIAAVHHVENLKPNVVDHVANLGTDGVDHVKNLVAVDRMEDLIPAAFDHVENLEPASVDHVENLEIAAADHLVNLGSTGDVVENLASTGDAVENPKPAVDHVEYLELIHEHVENLDQSKNVDDMNVDAVEDMNVDGVDVEDDKDTVNAMEDIVIPDDDDDDAEIQETGCNDLIDFEVCKVGERDPWDLSSKEGEQQHFLQHCTMTEPKLHEKQTRHLDDEDGHEDDEPVQGFSLSSGHLIQSQIPYPAPDFDNHHIMLGGPSSIFGNSSKRALDLDPEIPSQKRTRTDTSSWEQKPPDLEFCFDQIQQWTEKSKLAYMTTQQTTMSQQQMLFDELGSKDHLIQQLKMSNEELQRRRQAEIARYENELYAMTGIIDGYREALKNTQKSFAEYRKRLPLPAEPLYKDAGEGGVMKTVAELERERMTQKAARIIVERFENEWKIKFGRHVEKTDKFEARICEIIKGVQLLKESVGKRKAS